MKIQHDQLSANLARGLMPVYIIAGEEVLLAQEAEKAIRGAATQAGFTEQLRFTVDTNFDWLVFQQTTQNTSLFSDKQLLLLTFISGKISESGKKALTDFLQRPHSDKLLIIRTGKLDAATQKTTWYKAAEKIGVVVPIWPLAAAQIPTWIQQRLQAVGLQADMEGLQLLALRTEGNLLATAQEIEKLALIYSADGGVKKLTLAHIQEASHNSARYNVFNLVDAVLQGKPLNIVHVLKGLQKEAVEPILVLWALTREAHQWAQWLEAMQKGQTLSQILAGNFMMEKRKPLITRALQQQSLASVYQCLQHAAHIDKTIKGAATGNVWDELNKLSLTLAGVTIC